MKKSKTAISVALSFFLLPLTSCGNKLPSDSEVSEQNITKKLAVTNSKSEYDQYEEFSYSSLKVDALEYIDGTLTETRESIADFTIEDSNGKVIRDKDRLNPSTVDKEREYFVVKDGYTVTINAKLL